MQILTAKFIQNQLINYILKVIDKIIKSNTNNTNND
jgi:hypothetical protein